jgi:hypothetical protein
VTYVVVVEVDRHFAGVLIGHPAIRVLFGSSSRRRRGRSSAPSTVARTTAKRRDGFCGFST